MAAIAQKIWKERHALPYWLRAEASKILLSAGESKDSEITRAGIRMKYCSSGQSGEDIFLEFNPVSESVFKTNIKRCGQRYSPCCADKLAHDLLKRVEIVFDLWKKHKLPLGESPGVLFSTFTIPHDYIAVRLDNISEARAHWLECDLLLKKSWRHFSKTYRRNLSFKYFSHLRRTEFSFGQAGYHHHIHLAMFTKDGYHRPKRKRRESNSAYDKRLTDASLELSKELLNIWAKCIDGAIRECIKNKTPIKYIEKKLIKRASIDYKTYAILDDEKRIKLIIEEILSFDRKKNEPIRLVESIKEIPDKIGRKRKTKVYNVKGAATIEVLRGKDTAAIERYILPEISQSHKKISKKKGNVSWIEGLEHHSDELWFKEIYRHIVRETYGKSTFEFGTVRRPGETRSISFETYLLEENDLIEKKKEEETITIAKMDSHRYNKHIYNESIDLPEALDEYERTKSFEALEAVGFEKSSREQMNVAEKNFHEKNVLSLMSRGYLDSKYLRDHPPNEYFEITFKELDKLFVESGLEASLKRRETEKKCFNRLVISLRESFKRVNSFYPPRKRRPEEIRAFKKLLVFLEKKEPDELVIAAKEAIKLVDMTKLDGINSIVSNLKDNLKSLEITLIKEEMTEEQIQMAKRYDELRDEIIREAREERSRRIKLLINRELDLNIDDGYI